MASTGDKDIQAQIDRLREQVETLTQDRITPAAADFAGRAGSARNKRNRGRA